jgi:hypothetical protein
MPKVTISPKCQACLEKRDFSLKGCAMDCTTGARLTEIFALCRGNNDWVCRHIEDCEQDPRTCGYWTTCSYPIKIEVE